VSPSPSRIAVIGGGISGLATAFRLTQLGHQEVTLLEASSRLGGVLQTEQVGSCLVEQSADMFTTKQPGATRLCQDLGMTDSLIGTDDRYRRSFVVRKGKLLSTPPGLVLMQPTRAWPILVSPLLSIRGRLRMMGEYFVRGKTQGDTSLEEFAIRRFGVEAYQRLIQPMVGGIYTADPKKLSVAATMPQFLQMEQEHGSLVGAAWKGLGKSKSADDKSTDDKSSDERASGARYSAFVAPKMGMHSLVDELATKLNAAGADIRLNTRVEKLSWTEDGWNVVAKSSDETRSETFTGVVVATPAHVAASIIADVDKEIASLLAEISYASAAIGIFLLDRADVSHSLNGFGFVVPATENRSILAGSFASVKFPGRAADDQLLLRVFVGGAVQPQLLEHTDEEILDLALRDVSELLGVQGKPVWSKLRRWTRAMPQYHVGHVDRVATIDAQIAQIPGLELAGNAYHGVGIPFCAAGGYAAAERIAESM
jgi:protoporphyrinogen/coproporphyrinogen III oxidase